MVSEQHGGGHRVDGDDGVEIHPPKAAGGKGYLATLQSVLQQVPNVIVQGIPSVERAVVEKKTKEDGRSVSRPCKCRLAQQPCLLCTSTDQVKDQVQPCRLCCCVLGCC